MSTLSERRMLNPYDRGGKPRRGIMSRDERIASQDLLERQNAAIMRIRMDRLAGQPASRTGGDTTVRTGSGGYIPRTTEPAKTTAPKLTNDQLVSQGRAAMEQAKRDTESRGQMRALLDASDAKTKEDSAAFARKQMGEAVASDKMSIEDAKAGIDTKFAEREKQRGYQREYESKLEPEPDRVKAAMERLQSRIAESDKALADPVKSKPIVTGDMLRSDRAADKEYSAALEDFARDKESWSRPTTSAAPAAPTAPTPKGESGKYPATFATIKGDTPEERYDKARSLNYTRKQAEALSGISQANRLRSKAEAKRERVREANKNITIPKWQEGTGIGAVNRSVQRFLNQWK